MKHIFTMVSALAILPGAAFAQNLVANGTFDVTVPNNGTGGSWTAANNDGAGGWRSTGGNPGGTYILNDNGTTLSNPNISQALTLVIGQQYRISGQYALGNAFSANNQDLGVEIDGNLWRYTVPGSQTAWQTFSEIFTATSVNATLRLSGEWQGDSDPRVDNISVVAVPEPATLGMLAVLPFLRRRRK